MRNCIISEIVFLEGRECAQSKLLYRIPGRPSRNSNNTSYLIAALWTLFFLKCLSVPKPFLWAAAIGDPFGERTDLKTPLNRCGSGVLVLQQII